MHYVESVTRRAISCSFNVCSVVVEHGAKLEVHSEITLASNTSTLGSTSLSASGMSPF